MRRLGRTTIAIALICGGAAVAADPNFCDDPLRAVCGSGEWSRARREARIEATRKELELKAARRAMEGIGPALNCADGGKNVALGDQAKDEVRNEQLLLVSRVSGVGQVKKLYPRLAKAVAQVAFEGVGEKSGREQLEKAFARVTVFHSLQDMPEELAGDERVVTDFVAAYENFCGEEGWREGSFTYRHVPKGRKLPNIYVVICPGWLMAAPPGAAAAAANLTQVYAHELGHAVEVVLRDAGYKQNLSEYYACVTDRFGTPRAGKVSAEDRKELACDFWSQRALDHELLALGNASKAKKIELLRGAWSGLCGRKVEGDHPAGDYRVRVALEGSETVMRAMGCKPKRAACIPAANASFIPEK